ncbi:SRPBCC family protein [Spongisporangium articulatum]|uniref:SRPBCC family protein n=1 Tax=Spongisporangium articulatum TaxID=3362603 RepID=A0ABW8ASV3_9ACTN
MKAFAVTVPIAAPPGVVWEVLADVEGLPELTPSMTAVVLDPPGALAEGSTATITQPRLGTSTWTVTEFVPGRAFCWRASRPGLTTVAEHIVDADPARGGSVLHLRLTQLGPLGWLIGTVYAGLTRRYIALEAAGIKGAAERNGAPRGADWAGD